jgi:hypothetical protein
MASTTSFKSAAPVMVLVNILVSKHSAQKLTEFNSGLTTHSVFKPHELKLEAGVFEMFRKYHGFLRLFDAPSPHLFFNQIVFL